MSLFPSQLVKLGDAVLDYCRGKGLKLTTAESCTGGLIAAVLTSTPGCSKVYTHGFVTYANAAKSDMIGVDESLLKKYGAVSEEVARAMAEGALNASYCDIAISVTGIAGPDGGTEEKPVGLVHIACAHRGKTTHHQCHHFTGNREEIRLAAVEAALQMVLDF